MSYGSSGVGAAGGSGDPQLELAMVIAKAEKDKQDQTIQDAKKVDQDTAANTNGGTGNNNNNLAADTAKVTVDGQELTEIANSMNAVKEMGDADKELGSPQG